MIGDPTIERLSTDQRELLAALWQGRADSESSVRSVFTELVAELVAMNAHADVIALARRAESDEKRHATICTELATAYRGMPVPPTSEPAVRLPSYVEDRSLRLALHAVNLCCISETLATAFVDACLAECESPTLRDIHGRHLADEIHHARVGWAHIASISATERVAVAQWLPQLLRAQVLGWESRIARLPEAGVAGHGYPARARLVDVVRDAVRDLVLPGFDHVGIDTAGARAWFAAHMSTSRSV